MTTKLTTKLLNQKTAPKVFGQGQAYDFFKKGRVHYTSVGSMDPTNPNAQCLCSGSRKNDQKLQPRTDGRENPFSWRNDRLQHMGRKNGQKSRATN